jgi:hypothetical protein
MLTLEVEGFRLTINSRDERGHGAHVHAIKAGAKVLITLDADLTPYRAAGMKRRDGVVDRIQWLSGFRKAFKCRR